MGALPEARPTSIVEERPAEGAGQIGQCTEVGIVALPFTGQRGVQAVMDVVVPLCGQSVATRDPRRDQPRVVEVRFRNQ